MRFTAPVMACVAALALASCSSSSSATSSDNSAAPNQTNCATSTASSLPSPSTAAAVAWTGSVPTVSGKFGDKPVLSFSGSAPAGLRCGVLSEGKGPTVQKGQLLVLDFLGQVWDGKVFNNSYDLKITSGVRIGAGQVIPGWDNTVVGQKVGSRILISVPPANGYGSSGRSDGAIKGTDTIVYVIDIVAVYGGDAKSGVTSTPDSAPPAGITVTGAVGSPPAITVATGLAEPAQQVATLLDKGAGAPLGDGLAVVQVAFKDWVGPRAASSWSEGAPQTVEVKKGRLTSFDVLAGMPIGSRVLFEMPKNKDGGAVVIVVDIIALAPTAKETAAG